MVKWLVIALVLASFSYNAPAKVVDGHARDSSRWSVITRFVFSESSGRVDYAVTYPVNHLSCSPRISFYYDNVWSKVYPRPDMECAMKTDYSAAIFKVMDTKKQKLYLVL